MSTGELSEGEIVDSDGEQVLDPSQRPVDGLEDVFFSIFHAFNHAFKAIFYDSNRSTGEL